MAATHRIDSTGSSTAAAAAASSSSSSASRSASPLFGRISEMRVPNSSKFSLALLLFTSIGGAVAVHVKKPFQEKSTPIAIAIGVVSLALVTAVYRIISSVVTAANARFTAVNNDAGIANTEVTRLRQREADLIKTNELMGRAPDAAVPASLQEAFGHYYTTSGELGKFLAALNSKDGDKRIAAATDLVARSVDYEEHEALISFVQGLVEMAPQEETDDFKYTVLKEKLTEYGKQYKANKKELGEAKAANDKLKESDATFIAEVKGILEIGDDTTIQDAINGIKGKLRDAVAKQEASQKLLAFVADKLSVEEESSEANLGEALNKLARDLDTEKRAVGEAKTAAADTLKEIATALGLAEDSEIGAVQGEIAKLVAGKESAEIVGQIAAKIKPAERTVKSIMEKLDGLTAQVAAAERTRDEAIAAKEKFEPIVDALARLLSSEHDKIVEAVTALKAKAEAPVTA